MKTNPTRLLQALSAALVLLHFASCKSETSTVDNTRRAVDPALINNVPFRDFELDADAGDTISLPEGTVIYVPGGMFVDRNGKPVTGKVQIHYRAFYTPGQIAASGIIMQYDTAGEEHIFTSAGMFELQGTQNGNPIEIAPGKSIQMDFASTQNDSKYNYYSLDTANAKWNFVSTTTADSNALRKSIEKALSLFTRRPVEPREYNTKAPSINIDVDITDHPELAGYSNVIWQYAGKGNDPEQNKWIYDTEWSSAKLTMADENTCMYNMTLTNASKSFSTSVFPTLKGNNYQKALAEFKTKIQAFETAERERQKQRENLAQTTEFQRRLNIARFGMGNCDIFNIFGKRLFKKVRFLFENKSFQENPENVAVYVVGANGRTVTCFNGASEVTLTYFENTKNCIVAVLRGTNQVTVLGNDDFMAVVANGAENETGTFSLHTSSEKVSNSDELDELITKVCR